MNVSWLECLWAILRQACRTDPSSKALMLNQVQSSPVAVPSRTYAFTADDPEEDEDNLSLLDPFTHLSLNQPDVPSSSMFNTSSR